VFSFRLFLDAEQLMRPEALEHLRPIVNRLELLTVDGIEALSSIASRTHETDLL
jgi:hypothetical protein